MCLLPECLRVSDEIHFLMHAPGSRLSFPLTTPQLHAEHISNQKKMLREFWKTMQTMINVFIREPNNFNMREHLLQFWRSILTVVRCFNFQGCLFIVSCGALCRAPLCWWNLFFRMSAVFLNLSPNVNILIYEVQIAFACFFFAAFLRRNFFCSFLLRDL